MASEVVPAKIFAPRSAARPAATIAPSCLSKKIVKKWISIPNVFPFHIKGSNHSKSPKDQKLFLLWPSSQHRRRCLLFPEWIEDAVLPSSSRLDWGWWVPASLLYIPPIPILPPLQLERQWPWMQRSNETMYGRLTSYLTKRLHIVGACNAILSTCSSFLQKVPFCSVIWNKYIQIPEKKEDKRCKFVCFLTYQPSCKAKLKVRDPIFTLRLLAICFARVTFENLSADYYFVCRKPRENIATYRV